MNPRRPGSCARGGLKRIWLPSTLPFGASRLRDLTEAEYAALGIVDAAGVIERFITSGISHEERERIGELPRGKGLLGLIIRENRSIRIQT